MKFKLLKTETENYMYVVYLKKLKLETTLVYVTKLARIVLMLNINTNDCSFIIVSKYSFVTDMHIIKTVTHQRTSQAN